MSLYTLYKRNHYLRSVVRPIFEKILKHISKNSTGVKGNEVFLMTIYITSTRQAVKLVSLQAAWFAYQRALTKSMLMILIIKSLSLQQSILVRQDITFLQWSLSKAHITFENTSTTTWTVTPFRLDQILDLSMTSWQWNGLSTSRSLQLIVRRDGIAYWYLMATGHILLKTSSTFVGNTVFDHFNYHRIQLTFYSPATSVPSNPLSTILKRKYDEMYSLV